MKASLANGQVASSAASILAGTTIGGNGGRCSCLFTNVGGASETLVVTVQREGGTARRVARYVLAANETAYAAGAKVQPATGGAGAVDATTARTTLASDDPAVTSLAIMDDWDETNRCAVNPISGQVGVQGGSGASTALTQRVAIATDANAVDTELPAAAALADNTANPTTPLIGACLEIWDGATWDRAPGDATNGIKTQPAVGGAGAVTAQTERMTLASDDPAVTSLAIIDDWDESDRAKVNPIVGQAGVAAGAGAVGVTVQRMTLASDDPAVTALQIIDDWDNGASDGASVSGDVAHDGVDAGEPVKIGYKAIAHGANPTAVAASDRTDAYANRHGIPFVMGGHPNVITTTVNVADADGAQANISMSGTIGAGTKVVVTRLSIAADNDNTDDIQVRVGFGTATIPARIDGRCSRCAI